MEPDANLRLLNERRAIFVYEAARMAATAAGAPIVPTQWHDREPEFRAQFRDVIIMQCGPEHSESPADLHDQWCEAYVKMGWQYAEHYSADEKTHPDLVPYEQLGQLERDKDAVFVALCEIARLYIREDT